MLSLMGVLLSMLSTTGGVAAEGPCDSRGCRNPRPEAVSCGADGVDLARDKETFLRRQFTAQ